MIRLRTSPLFPKQIFKDPVYGICSRNTMLGVHRRLPRTDVDHECSKTMLLLANNRSIVEQLASSLEQRQTSGIGMERNVQDQMVLMPCNLSTLAPFYIEQFYFSDLEKICHFHHFDMYIAFGMKEEKSTFYSSPMPDIILDGYEHISHEWPQRSIVEKYMRDMLYRG